MVKSLTIVSKKDIVDISDDVVIVNATSRSRERWKSLSFEASSPVTLYGNYIANSVEKALEYIKVYRAFTDPINDFLPTNDYFKWAEAGWTDRRSELKSKVTDNEQYLYHYFNGRKFNDVECRKSIIIPLYKRAALKTKAWHDLKELYNDGARLIIWDDYSFNFKDHSLDYGNVIEDKNIVLSPAFILGMMLEHGEDFIVESLPFMKTEQLSLF